MSLPPERRFRLYNRIADIFHDHHMTEAEKAARQLSRQAARESPVIQEEIRRFMSRLRREAER